MIKPMPLYPGARVAVLCPSGPMPEGRLEPALESIRALGLDPVVMPSCEKQHGHFAGEDARRSADLNTAFADDTIAGILCMRGGYGAQRLMDRLDWDTIAAHPKFFGGYSDITALHIQLNQRCGMVTWHIPMPATEWYADMDDYTRASLRRALFVGALGPMYNPDDRPMRCLAKGRARGQLVGGNLSLVVSTLGTPWEIDTRHKLLFLEDVDEEPYRIDRMLLQLKQAGKLSDCDGILLGDFTNCEPKNPARSLTIEEVLRELLLDECKPVLTHVACGHSMPTMSLPLGLNAMMDATAGTLTILE